MKSTQWKKLVILAGWLCVFSATALAERPLIAKVVKVVDGDTIKITTNIRLAEIDCPESKQDGGLDATSFLAERVEDRRVAISLHKRGVYGRFIGTVSDAEGENLNHVLVGEGLCWVYKGNKNSELIELQKQAQEEKLGIWAGDPQAPWEWRKERRKKK